MTSRDEHNAVWMATLNTCRTVLTTRDNKKDDSYITKSILTKISAAGGMQKGTNGDESDNRLRTDIQRQSKITGTNIPL